MAPVVVTLVSQNHRLVPNIDLDMFPMLKVKEGYSKFAILIDIQNPHMKHPGDNRLLRKLRYNGYS